jgi:hypothetical protein
LYGKQDSDVWFGMDFKESYNTMLNGRVTNLRVKISDFLTFYSATIIHARIAEWTSIEYKYIIS